MAMATDWWNLEPKTLRRAFGIVFHAIASQWRVHRVLSGSPADSAGVLKDDILQDISGTPVQALTLPDKLITHIDQLDENIDQIVTFLRGNQPTKVSMRTRILRDLIEFEMALGGAGNNYCFSCPDCSPKPSGAAECKNCPNYDCAVS
jgi:hypothetical protein